METYLSKQAIAFLWAVVLGGGLGAVYDWFRVGRILKKKASLTVFLEDLLFSLIAALSTAYCFTLINYGQVRLFLLVGEVAGFLLYYNTVGALVALQARLLARLLHRIRAVLMRIGRYFTNKIKKIMNILKKPFIFLKEWCRMLPYNMKRRKKRFDRRNHRKNE